MRIIQLAEAPHPLKRHPVPKPEQDPELGHYFLLNNLVHYPVAGIAVDPKTGSAGTLCGRSLDTKFGDNKALVVDWDSIPHNAMVCNICYRKTLSFSQKEEDRAVHTREIQEGIATGKPKSPMPDLNREVSSVSEIHRYHNLLRGHLARMDITEDEKHTIISKLNELESRLAKWHSVRRRM